MITLLSSPYSLLQCTRVLHAQLHTHRSLVLRSSLVGELGSKWESSGGSSFPCASSQARSSRSFLLLARSAVGRGKRGEKTFSTPCQQDSAGKNGRQLLQFSRTPVKCSCSFRKSSNSTGAEEVRLQHTINTPLHFPLTLLSVILKHYCDTDAPPGSFQTNS